MTARASRSTESATWTLVGCVARTCPHRLLPMADVVRGAAETSDTHGFGVFAAEPTGTGDFVGENVGELVPRDEAHAIGQLYDAVGVSYLYTLTRDVVLDATRVGSRMRFFFCRSHFGHARRRFTRMIHEAPKRALRTFALAEVGGGGGQYGRPKLGGPGRAEQGLPECSCPRAEMALGKADENASTANQMMCRSTGAQCMQRLGCVNVGHAAATRSLTATVNAKKSAARLSSTAYIPPTNWATKPDRSATAKSKRRTRTRTLTRTKEMAAQRATRAASFAGMHRPRVKTNLHTAVRHHIGAQLIAPHPSVVVAATAGMVLELHKVVEEQAYPGGLARKTTILEVTGSIPTLPYSPFPNTATQDTTLADTSRGDRSCTRAGDGKTREEEVATTCSEHRWRSSVGVVPPASPSSRRLTVATARSTRRMNRPCVFTSARAASGSADGSSSLPSSTLPGPLVFENFEARQ
ncbi:hypothetical protein BU14_0101s0003 [Porphyra umbilicalis]|uniref:Uncharacterized protein n=1 Tax=Porphyra umbilicalis TaxID=2786 RepID=A0A1X6PCX7_PORUM|nr:hypothetical protein BU14_0101s0003 [Porphyra umbilicalis]|eukprot:OSX78722.1 hypothetical protein BU14_0101s0003 [Porphyra umbilicalis]